MASAARRRIEDQGCPLVFHTSGDPAPEYEDEYSLHAWMGAPVGAADRRSVCDACVRKILDGSCGSYRYDTKTGEVSTAQ
jgi:hypothetical protein